MPRPQISYQKQREGRERIAIRNLYALEVRKATTKLIIVAENIGNQTLQTAVQELQAAIKAEADYRRHEEAAYKRKKALKKDKNYTL